MKDSILSSQRQGICNQIKKANNDILFTSSFFLSTSSSCWISASDTAACAAVELVLAQLAPAGS